MSQSSAVATIDPIRPASLVVHDDWDDRRIEFIRKTYCGGAPDAIAEVFLQLCRRRRLAPEEKQVYLVSRAGDWVIQTGIDGYRLMADRTGVYAGSDDPVYEPGEDGRPSKATITVYKIVGGVRCPFVASARWQEYYPGEKQGFMWRKMPYLMLGKTAEALALRKAFPAELSGIYTDAEMDQANTQTPEQSTGQRARSGASVSEASTDRLTDWSVMYMRADKEFGIKGAEAFTRATGIPIKDFGGDPQAAWDALVAAQGGAGTEPAPDEQPDVIDVDGQQVNSETGEIVTGEEITQAVETEKPAKKPVAEFGKPVQAAGKVGS